MSVKYTPVATTIPLLLFFLSCLNLSAQAPQNKPKTLFQFGVNYGYNFSNLMTDPSIDAKWKKGSDFGIIAKFFSEPSVGMQAEIIYSTSGWVEEFDTPSAAYTRELRYLSIPLLTSIELGRKRLRPVLNIGPYLSFLIDDSIENNIEDSTDIQVYHEQEELNQFAYGFNGGIGALFASRLITFQLEGRYGLSLTNLFPNDVESGLSSSTSQNFSIRFALLYKLP